MCDCHINFQVIVTFPVCISCDATLCSNINRLVLHSVCQEYIKLLLSYINFKQLISSGTNQLLSPTHSIINETWSKASTWLRLHLFLANNRKTNSGFARLMDFWHLVCRVGASVCACMIISPSRTTLMSFFCFVYHL